jgi:hypothetical protein
MYLQIKNAHTNTFRGKKQWKHRNCHNKLNIENDTSSFSVCTHTVELQLYGGTLIILVMCISLQRFNICWDGETIVNLVLHPSQHRDFTYERIQKKKMLFFTNYKIPGKPKRERKSWYHINIYNSFSKFVFIIQFLLLIYKKWPSEWLILQALSFANNMN